MPKCLILFVEGDTEEEFYKEVIKIAKKKLGNKQFEVTIKYVNVKGCGGFKKNALPKFTNGIKRKYGNKWEYSIIFCSDTDVEMAEKPSITPKDWKNIENSFRKKGVKTVNFIKADKSIEDWFLKDADGIKKFLRLPQNTKLSGKTGYEKLNNLFRKAHKMYVKGAGNGFIAHLNMELILGKIYSELAPLYKELGVKLNFSDYRPEKCGK